MAATLKVSVCLVLVSITLAQNSKSLDERFEVLEQEFAAEKARMRSELESTREALDFTRSQLRETKSQLFETQRLLENQPGPTMMPSESNSETVIGLDHSLKSRTLSQILQLWKQNMTQGDHDRTPTLPKYPITLSEAEGESKLNQPEPLPGTRRMSLRGITDLQAISFHAELGIPADGLKILQTVVFDSAPLNTDGVYNSNNGVFTSPTSGTYYFTVTIMVFPNEKIETELVVNGNQALLTFAAGTSTFNQGTSSTSVNLQTGDRVWVRILNVPTIRAGINIRIMGGGWSSFTGFLIR
ncbi:uncharacterized protein LOC117330382 [Pecten maximus]|uniref:uncharacterized protein LOC117330382 n=1 Tax=Pecten maximus TaxID=6579 RepID=UPI001458697F|nr:uncharacterized protein LOC117330382 [Pecten maximus]